MNTTFARWATRRGVIVEWGNVIGGCIGQQFRETFATEEQAIEREQQALRKEPISEEREPVALKRERLP